MAGTVFVHSISFDPEGVEVTWAEESTQYENGLRIVKTALIPRALIADEMEELVEAAEAIVDAIGVIQRAPENTFKRER